MPVRLAVAIEATPFESVAAEPIAFPLSVNVTVLPTTGDPLLVSVAAKAAVPPYTPVAAATGRFVDDPAPPTLNGAIVVLIPLPHAELSVALTVTS